MATSDASKICEGDGNACKKDVQAHCLHCSKSLCRIHFLQHAQLIEEELRAELNSLADKFNDLSSRFDHVTVSSDFLKKPLEELEKWRIDAHKKIDQIVENKCQEIQGKFDDYQTVFATKNIEQVNKINVSKKVIAELIQKADASCKQMDDLQKSIDEAEKYLTSLNTHEINVITSTPICFIDSHTRLFDCQSTLVDELRNFKITYIRLNGITRNYYVKSRKNGTISDLTKSFIRQYTVLEQLARIELSSNDATDHQPKCDCILPTEVYNGRVHLQYNKEAKLNDIRDRDMIVFYETPYSLNEMSRPRILMPCLFQRLPEKQSFALPIYLNVPRVGCKGQDVLNALNDMLGKFFRLDPNTDRHLYNANIFFFANNPLQKSYKALNDVLQDPVDFSKVNTTLITDIDSGIADIYEENNVI
jgi:hypothetical protein